MTVLCGAMVSFYNKIPVFHIEAGLRSYDIFEPFPEEVMRQMTSRVSALNFAPTLKNKEALLKENISDVRRLMGVKHFLFITNNAVFNGILNSLDVHSERCIFSPQFA